MSRGKSITTGEFVIQEPGSPDFFFSMPDAGSLKEKLISPSSFIRAGADGSFTLELNAGIPVHLIFTAAGKRTLRTIFPATTKKQVSMEVTFYDKEFVARRK
ncbi:MAG: hypothetical protein WDO71_28285 [Bacteroidota bacterium]